PNSSLGGVAVGFNGLGNPHQWGDVPPAGHLPWAAAAGQAPAGHDAEGGVQRRAEAGAGEEVPNTEVHQQARQEEARRETGAQGLPGERALPTSEKLSVFISFALYLNPQPTPNR
ncbi:hypothetical protein CEXT_689161, partial [Caerostris extrusa]